MDLEDGAGCLLAMFLVIGMVFAFALIAAIPLGYLFMLMIGALHSEFGWPSRTSGLFPSIGIMFCAMFVIRAAFASSTSASVKS